MGANTNQQYHFLIWRPISESRAWKIRGKEEAIELASQAFKKASEERLRTMEQQLTWVARAWNNVKMQPMAHGNRFKDKAGRCSWFGCSG
jgi:hypothetical protein